MLQFFFQYCLSGVCAYRDTKLNINISLFFEYCFLAEPGARGSTAFTLASFLSQFFLLLLLLSSRTVIMNFEICEFSKKNRISNSNKIYFIEYLQVIELMTCLVIIEHMEYRANDHRANGNRADVVEPIFRGI